jgi:parvulin-like peptidyl-prolyl isomerase
MRRHALAVALALCAAPPAFAQDAPAARPAEAAPAVDPKKDLEPVALIDGVPITRGEYKEYVLQQAGDQLLDSLVSEKLIRREAAKLGVVVTPEDEAAWVEEQLREMADMREYEGVDKDAIRRRLAPRAGIGVLLERVVKARRTSEDGIRHEYELRYGEKRQARHILFQVKQGKDGKPDPESVAAAKKRADDTYADLKKGADFGETAKKVSEDPGSRGEGGELPEFARSDMVKEFADVAFALKEGEISQPVLSQFGWHIVQVTKVLAAAKPFDDAVKADLRAEAAKRPLDGDEVNRFLKEIRDGVKVEKLMSAAGGKG